MNKNNLVLLKGLLLSTSQLNIYRHTTDKKKKGKIVGNIIGVSFLYLLLMVYCVLMCIGYGEMGITEKIPPLCALTVTLASFVLTLLKTNGYLFNFKEYDMLMSLPFDAKSVAGCKFIYMYIKSLPWNVSISVAMLIGYAIYAKPAFMTYPIWVVLSFILPVIPMLIAAFIGFIFARISSGFRKKNIVQTVFLLAFTVFCFFSRFLIQDLIENNKIEQTLESASDIVDKIVKIYIPAAWFTGAVRLNVIDLILLIAATVILFELVFIPVGRSYRMINSKLKSHAAARKFRMTAQKKYSVLNALAFKELKRMTGSATYMVNVGIGEVLVLILSIAALFINVEDMIHAILQGAPITKEMLYPALPLIIYFCLGMVATTAITPSLEGKNYWIVKSLPISPETLCKGKMLFNMYLTVPFMVISTLCLGLSARMPFVTLLLSLVLGFLLCAFSTTWGCVCGIKHMRLDWENEIEVIKQGSAVTVYIFPNLSATMILIVLVVFLGTRLDINLVMAVMILVTALLTALCYKKSMKLARK